MVIYLSVVPRSPCSGYGPVVPNAVGARGKNRSWPWRMDLTTQGDPRRGRESPVAIQAQLQDLLLLGDTMGIIEASGDLSLLHCSAKVALSSSRISSLTTRPPCCNFFVFVSWFQNCWGARVGETGVQAGCMAA